MLDILNELKADEETEREIAEATYRTLLNGYADATDDDISPQDKTELRNVMRELNITPDDVAADVRAIQKLRQLQKQILTDEQKAKLAADLDESRQKLYREFKAFVADRIEGVRDQRQINDIMRWVLIETTGAFPQACRAAQDVYEAILADANRATLDDIRARQIDEQALADVAKVRERSPRAAAAHDIEASASVVH